MKNTATQNIKVGLLVIAGLFFLVFALYMIGSRSNLFSNNFKVYSTFSDIKGLMPGNNVRFSGITVGTVSKVEIIKAGEVRVWMNILESARKHIQKNTLVAIGTDGFIGSKIVILTAGEAQAALVESGDELKAAVPFDTDKTLRLLNESSADISVIVQNLRVVSEKVKSSQMIWNLLSDSLLGADIRGTVSDVRQTGQNAKLLTRDLQATLRQATSGSGNLSVLLNDTSLKVITHDLTMLLSEIKEGKGVMGMLVANDAAADNVAQTFQNIRSISANLNAGTKSINSIVSDTVFLYNLERTMYNIGNGTQKLDENLEALKHSFLFRGYFKKQARKAKKEQ